MTRCTLFPFTVLLFTLVIAVGCTAAPTTDVPPGRVGVSWTHEHAPPATTGLVRGRVQAIIDGDTIRVTTPRQTVTVRLLGIDTPEKPGGPRPAECFGAEASRFLAELAPVGSSVLLSRDQQTRDQYGRLLAWVHRDDGVWLNLAMVESGHAMPLFFAPNDTFESRFEAAGHAARRNELGFWPACGGPDVTLDP